MADLEVTSSSSSSSASEELKSKLHLDLPPAPVVAPIISPRSLGPIRVSSLSNIPQLPDPADIPFDQPLEEPFAIGTHEGPKRKVKRHHPPVSGEPLEFQGYDDRSHPPAYYIGGPPAYGYPYYYPYPHSHHYPYYPHPSHHGHHHHHHHHPHHHGYAHYPPPPHHHGHAHYPPPHAPIHVHGSDHITEPPPPPAVPPTSHAAAVSRKSTKTAVKNEVRRQLRNRRHRHHHHHRRPQPLPVPYYYPPYESSDSDSDSDSGEDDLAHGFGGLGIHDSPYSHYPPHPYPYSPYYPPYAYYPPPCYPPHAYYPPPPPPPPHGLPEEPHFGSLPPPDPKREKLVRIESGKPAVPKPRPIQDQNPWWNKAWRHTSFDPQVVEPYAVRLDENGEEIRDGTNPTQEKGEKEKEKEKEKSEE